MLDEISADVVFLLLDVSLGAFVLRALAALVIVALPRRSMHAQQRARTLVLPVLLYLSGLRLAGLFLSLPLPVAILLAVFHPTAAQSQDGAAVSQAVTSPKTEGPILTIRGTLLMPDGSVAKDAVLEQPAKGTSDIVSATIAAGQFEIRTTGTKLNNPAILCRTPDWNFQASLIVRSHSLRSMCLASQRVTLTPSKVIRIKVTDDGQAVPDAHVQVEAGSVNYVGRTRANGVVELEIPQNEEAFLMSAWTDDHRIGGLHTARRKAKDPLATDFHVEIDRDEPVRVQVVDARQQPMANVTLTFAALAGEHGELFVGQNPTSSQTTNLRGEAVFAWVPNWPKKRIHIEVAENSPWRRIGEGELKRTPDGARQLEVAPSRTTERIAVEGQLSGVTTDVSGLLVEFWSFQGEEEDKSDVLYSRSDAAGRFTARVLPGSEYTVFVNDNEFVSNTWHGVVVLPKSATVRKPELTLSEGVPLEILVTKGPDQEPMKNAWLHFESLQESRGGRRFWGRTDERGRFAAPVSAGELNVRVSEGDWELRKTIPIVDGEPARIHLHRKRTEKETITGRLMLPPGMTADLSNTTVTIAGIDGEYKESATVTANAQGNFNAATIADRIGILATSPDEKFFGSAIVDVGKDTIEIPMHPTIAYRGRILGAEDRPLDGVRVRMAARLWDHNREYPTGTPAYQRHSVRLFADRSAISDAEGYFVYPATPQRIELTLWFTRPGEMQSDAFRKKWFEPDEVRPAEVIRIGVGKADATNPIKPLESLMSDTLRDCRLAEIHALVVVSGAGDIATAFIDKHVLGGEGSGDIYSYLPRTINGPEAAGLPNRRDYFAARKWPIPETNSLFLAALDGFGKELGRLTLDLRDDQAAAKAAAAFIKRHLPRQHDAKADFEAALAEAKQSGRVLWVRVGQSRCAPCFSLSRWIDSQREVLSKDYVLFKFDDARDLNGKELSVALKFDAHGVPCHAILDSNGKVLINSIGPLGNIGDPSGDFEGISHLKKMLKSTARKLSDEEIESLIRSLPQD